MDEYWITYKRKRGRPERLVVMPTVEKLLKWIEKNGPSCSYVLIQVLDAENDKNNR